MTRLADFIIGGAPRSGTTWLYVLLDKHPQIYMAKPVKPEPKFFLIDELYEKGADYYSAFFSGAAPNQLTGEKSTNYLESSVAATRMRETLPQVKLIFLLRDPVERAYSNFLWSQMNGLETRSFAEAIANEEESLRALPPALRYARPYAYYSRGLYADMLAPYYAAFPAGQILCLRYEDIYEAPDALTEKVHHFLGVSLRAQDADGLGRINAAEQTEDNMPRETKMFLQKAYAEPNRRLGALLGPQFRMWEY